MVYDGNGNMINFSNVSVSNKLKGKNIIILADSVFDYETPDGTNIGELLAYKTGANIFNWAQGGCQMAEGKATDYDPYSFVGMVNALTTGVFDTQEQYATGRNFTTQVAEMRQFDMSNAEYVIIAYGTNDFWANNAKMDSPEGYDTHTFEGALKYGIKTLLSKYPKLKLLVLNMQKLGSIYIDSGGIGDVYSSDWNDIINSVCEKYAIPEVDIWNDSMINEFTKATLCNGAPHLSHEGKMRYVALIENALNLYY